MDAVSFVEIQSNARDLDETEYSSAIAVASMAFLDQPLWLDRAMLY